MSVHHYNAYTTVKSRFGRPAQLRVAALGDENSASDAFHVEVDAGAARAEFYLSRESVVELWNQLGAALAAGPQPVSDDEPAVVAF